MVWGWPFIGPIQLFRSSAMTRTTFGLSFADAIPLADAKVEQPSVQRLYIVPSYKTGQAGEPAALEVLAHHLGGGSTSVLYKTLVLDTQIAVAAGAGGHRMPRCRAPAGTGW